MLPRSQIQGIRMLDDFICEAINNPTLSIATANGQEQKTKDKESPSKPENEALKVQPNEPGASR